MNLTKIYVTTDECMFQTLEVWEELLDMYELDELTDLYFDIFDQETRIALRPYMKMRIKKLKK